MSSNPFSKDAIGDLFDKAGLGGLGGKPAEPSDKDKMIIGLMNKKISALEKQVSDLTNAVIVLINSKEKKGSAIVPKHVKYRKPTVFVEWVEHKDDSKYVGMIKIKLSE